MKSKAVSAGPEVVTTVQYRVRLRNSDVALKGVINGTNSKGEVIEERWELQPNRWVSVKKIVYDFLRTKYDKVRVYDDVPDWDPGGPNDRPERTPRTEEYQAYIIEFKE